MATVEVESAVGNRVEIPSRGWKHRVLQTFTGLGLTAVSLVVCILLAEGAVRLAGIKIFIFPPHRGDRLLGTKGFAPGSRIRTKFPEYDNSGYLTVVTNNLGFPQEEDTAPVKKPGTRRVAIVGDSQTAGAVGAREAYPHQLQEILNSRGGVPYELLNGGVGRWSPYQYYIQTAHVLTPLAPDHVMVAIYAGNDMQDLVRRDDRPYLTVSRDGSVVEHPPEFVLMEDPDGGDEWLRKSRLFSWLKLTLGPNVVYQVKRANMLFHNLPGDDRSIPTLWTYTQELRKLSGPRLGFVTQDMNQHLWFKFFPKTLSTAYVLNRHVMQMFQQLAKEKGFRLTYLILPAKVQIEPDEMADAFEDAKRIDPDLTPEKIRGFADTVSDEVIKQCRELGVEYIDPRADLMARREGRRLYFHDDMHLNVAGARVLAQTVADWYTAHGL